MFYPTQSATPWHLRSNCHHTPHWKHMITSTLMEINAKVDKELTQPFFGYHYLFSAYDSRLDGIQFNNCLQYLGSIFSGIR